MTTYDIVTMSVYASKDQEKKADGKHLRSTYNLLYQKVDSDKSQKGNQGIQKKAGITLPNAATPAPGPDKDDSVFRTLNLEQEWDDNFRFRLALWSTDKDINEDESWARCTFRPAHDAGVVDWKHAYPITTDAFKEYLMGAHLSDPGKWQDLSPMNPFFFGMKIAGTQTSPNPNTGKWYRTPSKPYTFAKAWRGWGNLKWLKWGGKYEIGVQVGLVYKGDQKANPPVFCEVDPEMDLGPD